MEELAEAEMTGEQRAHAAALMRVNHVGEVCAQALYQAQALTMSWCLDCHRNPAAKLRPLDKITDLNWKWSDDPNVAAQQQKAQGEKFVHDWRVESLDNCSACHR